MTAKQSQNTNVFTEKADGTLVDVFGNPDCPSLFRFAATDNRGNPSGILAEMRARLSPANRLPWIDLASRNQALPVVDCLPLHTRTKRALAAHVASTPYAADFEHVKIVLVPTGPNAAFLGFNAGRACRVTHGVSILPLADLIDEAKANPENSLPYESPQARNAYLARIDAEELDDDTRKAFMRHVARTGYLQVAGSA